MRYPSATVPSRVPAKDMTMRYTRVLLAGLLLGAMGLEGCSSTSRALGLAKVTPDEFRVVTKAPLILPPDYSLDRKSVV